MRLNLVTMAIMIAGVVWACLHASSVAWDGVKIAGAAIAAVALALIVVARVQLGASFSVQAKARTLVTTGLIRGYATRSICLRSSSSRGWRWCWGGGSLWGWRLR